MMFGKSMECRDESQVSYTPTHASILFEREFSTLNEVTKSEIEMRNKCCQQSQDVLLDMDGSFCAPLCCQNGLSFETHSGGNIDPVSLLSFVPDSVCKEGFGSIEELRSSNGLGIDEDPLSSHISVIPDSVNVGGLSSWMIGYVSDSDNPVAGLAVKEREDVFGIEKIPKQEDLGVQSQHPFSGSFFTNDAHHDQKLMPGNNSAIILDSNSSTSWGKVPIIRKIKSRNHLNGLKLADLGWVSTTIARPSMEMLDTWMLSVMVISLNDM